MNWVEYWKNLTTKNPSLKDENQKITMDVGKFRKQQKQAFELGEQNGSKQVGDNSAIKDIFGGIF